MTEVLLALGILSFAVLMVLALVPLGLQTNQDSQEESVAVNIVGSLVADWRAVDTTTNASFIFHLPAISAKMTPSNTFGISDSGQVTNIEAARYRVAYTVVPPATNSFSPYYVHFTLSWPAQATNNPARLEFVATLPSTQ